MVVTTEKKILLRLPQHLAEGIRIVAEGERRSINSELVIAVEQYLARRKHK